MPTMPATRVDVVTWNVLADAYAHPDRYPAVPADLLAWPGRRARIVDTVAAFDAPIVCLQEASVDLAAALEATLDAHVHWTPKTAGKPDGLITVTRGDVTFFGAGDLDHDTTGAVTQVLAVTVGGRRLWVANTHLRWSDRPGTDHVGYRQVRQLLDALTPVAQPTLIVGDSNDEPGGPVRTALTDGGFTDPVRAATAVVDGHQVPGGRPVSIDVIAGRGVHVERLRIPEPAGVLPDATHPSDHVPVHATVTLP